MSLPSRDTGSWSAASTRLIVEQRALAGYAQVYNWVGGQVPCECCGEWCHAEMHHRRYRSRGGDWRPSNIVALCSGCHHQVTTCHTAWAREMGLSVSQWSKPEDVAVQVWYAQGHRVFLDNEGGFTVGEPAA